MLAILQLIIITFIPCLELRASIPVGFFSAIKDQLSWPMVALICTLTNIGVGLVTFWLMGPVILLFRRWAWFERRIWPRLEKTQHKLRPYVEKYGEWGLAIFIGVPLPGTGAYSGALGAFLLGFDRRRFLIANAIGVIGAGIAVTAICLMIQHGAIADDSLIRRIFIKQI